MRFEFSAGGVVLRQAQAIGSEAQARRDFGSKPQSSKKKLEVLVCQHSQHHGWVFPKGLIGDRVKGEGYRETALREVKEETGITARIVKELPPTTYWYRFSAKGGSASGGEGEKIRKTVYYFLMEYVSGDIKNHDFEMEKVEWLPVDEVEGRLTYKSDKEVWRVALRAINRQPTAGHPKDDRLKAKKE